jgi:hypothetical protein
MEVDLSSNGLSSGMSRDLNLLPVREAGLYAEFGTVVFESEEKETTTMM